MNKTIRPAVSRTLRSVLGLSYRKRLRRFPELAELIAEMAASRSAAIDQCDALALFEHVSEQRPENILELGAGTSSAVIALAILHARRLVPAYQPRFVAVEERSEWMDYHVHQTPAHLSACIEWTARAVETTSIHGVTAVRYRDLPDMKIGFLHIDGPDLQAHNAQASIDALDLIGRMAPAAAVAFDGREASARLAAAALERAGFRFRRHPFTLNHWFIRERSSLSVEA
jgi:hypothetical protein